MSRAKEVELPVKTAAAAPTRHGRLFGRQGTVLLRQGGSGMPQYIVFYDGCSQIASFMHDMSMAV